MVATTTATLTKIHIIGDVAAVTCVAVEAFNVAAVAAEVAPRRYTEVDTVILEVEVPLVRAPTTTITHLDATQASELAEEQTQRMRTEVALGMEVQLIKRRGSSFLSKGESGMDRAKVNVRRPFQST